MSRGRGGIRLIAAGRSRPRQLLKLLLLLGCEARHCAGGYCCQHLLGLLLLLLAVTDNVMLMMVVVLPVDQSCCQVNTLQFLESCLQAAGQSSSSVKPECPGRLSL
jgi:hypothetical protein